MSVVVRILFEVAYKPFVQAVVDYMHEHPKASRDEAITAVCKAQNVVLDDGEMSEVVARVAKWGDGY